MNLSCITVLAWLAAAITLPAQTSLLLTKGCAYSGNGEPGREAYVFEPSAEAEKIVSEIVDAISLPKNFIVKSADVENALATTEDGQRYILYSTSFLEKFKADANTRWAAYSVLAHEIGHHLSGHDFAEKDLRKRKKMELEADLFSGGVLYLLGASLAEAQAGIRTFALAGETTTHPPASARMEAVANGWKRQEEKNINRDSPLSVVTTPQKDLAQPGRIFPPQAPEECYRIQFTDDFLVVRNRPLTQEELNICNQCSSWTSAGGTHYEDMNKRACQLNTSAKKAAFTKFKSPKPAWWDMSSINMQEARP